MNAEHRRLHPDQRSTVPSLLEAQRRLMWEWMGNDLEIYDDQGNLVAITSRDNPNLDQILADLRSQYDANGGTQ